MGQKGKIYLEGQHLKGIPFTDGTVFSHFYKNDVWQDHKRSSAKLIYDFSCLVPI